MINDADQLLPEIIYSQRLILRKHELELAETMFAYVDRDRERLRKFLPWVDSTRTIDDEIAYIQMAQEEWKTCSLFDYGIFNQSTGIYMGNVGVHTIVWEKDQCELGYWILGEFEGKGFMSEAVSALERICFDIGFRRIEIRCSSLNSRSATIPRKLGYSLEKTLERKPTEAGITSETLVFVKTHN